MPVPRLKKAQRHLLAYIQQYFWIYLGWFLPSIGLAQEACLLVPVPLAERAQQAALIVEAKVMAQQTYWDAAHQNIYTQNTLQLFKILTGTAPETIAVVTEGGRVGDTFHAFSGTLRLAVGEQGIFFLVPATQKMRPSGQSELAYTVYSSSQGFIQYDVTTQQATEPFKNYPTITADLYPALKKVTGADFNIIRPHADLEIPLPNSPRGSRNSSGQRLKAVPTISDFTPDTLAAGTGGILTIHGQNFGSARDTGSVEFRNADNGGASFIKALETDYISWSDAKIQVRIPGKSSTSNTPGSGEIRVTTGSNESITSTQRLVIPFSASQVSYEQKSFMPRLINANGQGGYTFYFNTGFAQNTPAKEAFTRALNTWSCYTGLNWHTGEPLALNVTADDNLNLVRFDADGELPRGVLARCISRYKGCGGKTADQWRVSEMDMVFNQSARWYFGVGQPDLSQFDFETVTLHEMGHGHQLNHVIKLGTVMHYAIPRGQVTRQLNARTDIAGGQFIMARSITSNSCGPGRTIPQPFMSCAPPPAILTFTVEPRSEREVLAAWTLAVAHQPASFTVERSKDAVHWQPIGTLPHPGNSTETARYTLSDPKPLPGASYYRLKILNPDRTFDYSALERINLTVPTGLAISPNPVTGGTLWLQYISPESGRLTIYLFDALGRKQKTFTRPYYVSSDVIDLDVSGLSPGLYVLVYADGRQTRREKFIKL